MIQTRQSALIHKWVEQIAQRIPSSIAVIHHNEQLTYQQLNEQANQLAHYLIAQGAGSEQLVGVCLERSSLQIVALLAILKAGSAYLPLDLSYPSERLGYMLDHAKAPLVLTEACCPEALPETDARMIDLGELASELAESSKLTPIVPEAIDPLAYVIYTSGSTGKPKGVAMSHVPLVNLLDWQRQASHAGQGSRTLQFTPISFDVSFQEIFGTLTTGGTLVLVDEACRKDPIALLHYLESEAVERLFLPFVALRQLAEAAVFKQVIPTRLSEVITAGEQLRITKEIRHWFEQMPRCSLHNHYGPSETHVVTALTLVGEPQDWAALPSIGYLVDNVQAHLLDEEQQPVSPGEVGELYFGGPCLARGYLNCPEKTAERFIADPLGQGRLYKTGDLARQLVNGELEYLGRSDQQVKIRGYRIEPGEIETQLEQHPGIQEAVVIALSEPSGERYLVGYLLPSSSEALMLPSLRTDLLEQLPDYFIPAQFRVVEAWPLTPSGKVDRKALPQLTSTELRTHFVKPITETEQQVAQLWQELLHQPQVSRIDSFFELGGDSLKAVQLLYRLEQYFGQAFSLDLLLTHPSLEDFCTQLDQQLEQANIDGEISSELNLDPQIQPRCPAVFLTGATGNLGGPLLVKLLENPQLEVHCLLRGESPGACLDRLRESLENQRLWQASFEGRIIPVPGDLSQARFGLSEEAFQTLGERISAIYHSGAWVNLAYPYTVLKQANVDSLEDILRLASYQANLPIHFVSTVDVWVTTPQRLRSVGGTTPAGPVSQLPNGYAQSKYIAEQLLEVARMRGFKVCIYRPSNIIGHHLDDPRQAHYYADSFVAKMLKGCIQMGCAPEVSASLNLIAADQVSELMGAVQRESTTSVLAVNAQGCSWSQAVAFLNERGFELTLIAYEDWLLKLTHLEAEGIETALTPLLALLKTPDFLQTALGGFDFNDPPSIATQESSSLGTVVSLTTSLGRLAQYCDALIAQGELPAPRAKARLKQLIG